MRRVLFAFAFSLLAAQLGAGLLPRVALLPAAFLVAVVFAVFCLRRQRGYPLICCAGALLALVLFCAQMYGTVLPQEELAGREYPLQARVQEVSPGYGPKTVQATLLIQELDGKRARIRVICDNMPRVQAADVVEGTFELRRIPEGTRRSGLYADRIYLRAVPAKDLKITHGRMHWMDHLRNLRARLASGVMRQIPGVKGQVLAAMTLGECSALTPQIRRIFRKAGLSHLLVVSGLHLTLLCGVFPRENWFRGRFRRLRAVASLVLVLFMMGITGFTPSVCRAGIVAILYDIGLLFLQPSDGLTSLGASILILCTFHCYASGDVGLQLSYAATLGVLFAASLQFEALWAVRKEKPPRKKRCIQLAGLILPSFFAAVFTMPVQLWHRMPISGVSLLANLLTLWLIQPILLCGIGCAVLGLLPGASAFRYGAARLGEWLVGWLIRIAEFCGRLPFAQARLPRGYSLFVWAVLFALGILLWNAQKFQWMALAAPCFVLAASLCGHILSQDVVTVTLLGSSRSPCAVIAQNSEALVLFQGGESNEAAVGLWMEQNGVESLSLLADLRQKPQTPLRLEARRQVTAEALPWNTAHRLNLDGMELSLLNQTQGNLALVRIDGYRILMNSGKATRLFCPVDLLLTGGDPPVGVRADTLLTTRRMGDWPIRPRAKRVLVSAGQPYCSLRPGRSCRFYEVTDVTHR